MLMIEIRHSNLYDARETEFSRPQARVPDELNVEAVPCL
jgi:hypothetical protein